MTQPKTKICGNTKNRPSEGSNGCLYHFILGSPYVTPLSSKGLAARFSLEFDSFTCYWWFVCPQATNKTFESFWWIFFFCFCIFLSTETTTCLKFFQSFFFFLILGPFFWGEYRLTFFWGGNAFSFFKKNFVSNDFCFSIVAQFHLGDGGVRQLWEHKFITKKLKTHT